MPIKKAQLQHFTVLYSVAHYTVKNANDIKKKLQNFNSKNGCLNISKLWNLAVYERNH